MRGERSCPKPMAVWHAPGTCGCTGRLMRPKASTPKAMTPDVTEAGLGCVEYHTRHDRSAADPAFGCSPA